MYIILYDQVIFRIKRLHGSTDTINPHSYFETRLMIFNRFFSDQIFAVRREKKWKNGR